MQIAQHVQSNSSVCVRRSVQQVCRLQSGATTAAPRACVMTAAVAGSLRSIEQEAVSVSIPDALPANQLKKAGYSTTAAEQSLPADIKQVLFSAEAVKAKVAELATQICKDYKGKPLAIIGVLNGAFIFTSDLVREVSKEMPDVRVDFMKASSYGAASVSNGAVTVKEVGDLSKWAHYNILLVEDIIDSGHTLARLSTVLKDAGADTVKVVALLDKKGRRRVECFPDYCGWECPNEFVVGYGLDFNERFRCLPYVAALKEEAYAGSGH